MNIEELRAELWAIHERQAGPRDIEADHGEADKLLLAYIDNPDVTEAYEAIERWYA